MYKKLLAVAAVLAATIGLYAQENIVSLDFEVQKGDISIVDIDADGDLDILIVGENGGVPMVQLFQNNGDLTFEKVESVFQGGNVPTLDFGDVNGDGLMDILQSGFGDTPIVNLYTSNESNEFAVDELSSSLIQIAPGLGIADLNNDGHTDIFIFGNHNIEDQRPKVYLGNSDGGFDATSPFDSYQFIDSKPQAVDYDSDGDLDLWVMAGYEVNKDARFGMIFENDGGEFTAVDPGIVNKGPGSSDWGDYDADGDLDLLIGGYGYVNSGEDNDMIYRIYENDGGTFTEAVVFQPFGAFSPGNSSRFADWDNDGDLDVIVTGWNPDAEGQRVGFFINTGGSFELADYSHAVPGVSESAIEVGDLDNDGDLDLVINGFSGNQWNGEGSAFGKNISVVIENTTAGSNEAPAAPSNLAAESIGQKAVFSWDAPADDHSSVLTYNFYLIDSEGYYYYAPLADMTTGDLMIQQKGNVELNTSWTVQDLPYGEYEWRVQAIDNSFAGSTFASGNFTHQELVLSSADIADAVIYPNPSVSKINLYNSTSVVEVGVLTLDGKLVKTLKNQEGTSYIEIQVASGIYLVKMTHSDGSVTTQKAVVK